MSEELNLGAAAEEEDERRGGGAAAGGRRVDRVSHPLLLALPEKVAEKWRGCERRFCRSTAATEVDGYFGTRRAGKAYHHFDQDA